MRALSKRLGAAAILCGVSAVVPAQELDFLDELVAPAEPGAESQPPPTEPPPGQSAQPAEPERETIPVPVAEAKPTPPAPPPPRRQPMLEEIVVTAQKRAESIQDTPISMAAFDAEMLQERGIAGVDDLQGNVPGLDVEPFPTQNSTLRIFIRGIGLNDAQITQDPAVGIYMDGVYIARSSGLAVDIADLQRVEVLRGPQGTLYGRNTTGGAVNLITKRPDPSAFSMNFSGAYGQRELGSLKGTVNIPLSDEAAVKFGMLAKRQGGFVENTGPGGDFGDRDALGFRADLRWKPQDWLTIDYGYDSTAVDAYAPIAQAILPPDADKGGAELIKEYGQLNTVYSSERLRSLATGMPLEESTTRIQGHALTLTVPLGEQELKYIGAYRTLEDRYYTDLGGGKGSTSFRLDTHRYEGPAANAAYGGPVPLVIPVVDQSQWSHELQLSGDAWDGGLRYIVGGFFFSEEAVDFTPFSHQASAALLPAQAGALYELFPDLINQVASLAAPRVVIFNMRDSRGENEAFAAFGQATWTPEALEQRLHLTLGYRHSRDTREAEKSYTQDTYLEVNVNGVGTARLLQSVPPFDHVRGSRSYTNDSYSFIAAYDLTDSANLYGKIATGYRSGGFNLRDPQINGAAGPASDGVDYGFGFTDGFAPETLRSAEVGIKSDLLDGRLRVNADVFLTQFRDMQTNFLIAGTLGDTKARNAGKARIVGMELEITAAVTESLRLSAEYAYLDAKVEEIIDAEGNNVADQYPFPAAPRHSGVVAADFTFMERDWGTFRGSVNYSYTDDRAGGGLPGRSDLSHQPGYGLLNGRLALSELHTRGGKLEFALAGHNLLDEEYITTAIPTLPHSDRAVFWGEPRRFGAEISYVFQ